jgi:4-oxalocrotonate tautomerase
MPLVRIDLQQGKSAEYRKTIGDVVYDAMTAVINVPEHDRFQVINEHHPDNLIFDRTYLGIERTDVCIIMQITLSEGRSVEQKQAFYETIADGLHERLGLRREDVVIVLVDVHKENWSFGNGVAQYV